MARRRILLACVASLLSLAAAPGPSIDVAEAEAILRYPDSIDFMLHAASAKGIVLAEVEYGLLLASCATDINRATPEDFAPGTVADTVWTWDMRQSGSLPPGAQLWWRWHIVDASGDEHRTPTQTITWLDSLHPWQTLSESNLSLHTYSASPDMQRQLLQAAVNGAARLRNELGPLPVEPIHLYVYDSTEAMREAILFEPQWTGGMAFPEYRTIILGISEDDLAWGLDAVQHELAHVVVGNLVSACYSRMPNWLSEGLAMVAEGGLDPSSQDLLDQAIERDSLYPVRALTGSFTEDPSRASLAYAQSYGLVTYLLEARGRQSVLDLLAAIQAGSGPDEALRQVYGIDADGLEQAWREWIGAAARPSLDTATQASPTVVPTYQPLSRPPVAITATPIPHEQPPSRQPSAPDDWFCGLLVIAVSACACLTVVGLTVIVLLLLRRRQKKLQAAGGEHA